MIVLPRFFVWLRMAVHVRVDEFGEGLSGASFLLFVGGVIAACSRDPKFENLSARVGEREIRIRSDLHPLDATAIAVHEVKSLVSVRRCPDRETLFDVVELYNAL